MIDEIQWLRNDKIIDDRRLKSHSLKSGARALIVGRWPTGANEVWIRDATGDDAALKKALANQEAAE